jgi:hypothetical protein
MMNQRIRKLADEVADLVPAGVYTIEYESGKSGVEFTEDALEKFVELIVRECAQVADLADENKCEWIGGNILTYFGVKDES